MFFRNKWYKIDQNYSYSHKGELLEYDYFRRQWAKRKIGKHNLDPGADENDDVKMFFVILP